MDISQFRSDIANQHVVIDRWPLKFSTYFYHLFLSQMKAQDVPCKKIDKAKLHNVACNEVNKALGMDTLMLNIDINIPDFGLVFHLASFDYKKKKSSIF